MTEHPSGAHLVLEGRATEGVDLIAIGYKCNSRKVISFICHRNAGSTKCTGLYEAKWKDENNNTQTRRVPRPDIIDRYFRKSNLVDLHNQARQSELRLEKHWVTQTCYFDCSLRCLEWSSLIVGRRVVTIAFQASSQAD